ncbi:MAG: type II toxin-antitoxin system RelE/ParE family toxin [Acidobacteriota bacterium]
MARLRWSPQALEDLEAICRFIATDSPQTARRVGQRLFAAVDRLERFPLSGRVVPELSDDAIREVRWKRYRIVYRVRTPETVEVLTVFHGARMIDLQALLIGR